jgi:pimeloyl-ACP methyl ester carboxylesterase
VIGWGAGAMFASAFTARYPNIVERLALVEPTAPSTERAESTGDLDARLEDRHALQRRVDFPGLADRLGFMLDEVAEGDGSGAAFDRRVMNDETWQQSLHDIRAETLIVSTGVTPDARWYQKRIPGVLMSSGWPSPATSIVDAWPELLRFMRPRESPGGVRSSNLQGGLPFPQAPHLPR